MQQKSKLWRAFLVVGIAALAVPAFVQGQGGSPGSPGMSSTRPDTGSTGSSSSSRMGSPGVTGSPSSPSTSPAAPPSSGAGMESSEKVGKATGDQATTEADRALNQRIREALGASAEKVHITTENGEVTLHGSVATEKEKADIAAKVQQTAGVKKVNNQLQMAPSKEGSSSGSMGPSSSSGMGSSSSRMGSSSTAPDRPNR